MSFIGKKSRQRKKRAELGFVAANFAKNMGRNEKLFVGSISFAIILLL